jgi:hypothetical protein
VDTVTPDGAINSTSLSLTVHPETPHLIDEGGLLGDVGLAGGLVGAVGLAGGLVGAVGLAGGLVGAVGLAGGLVGAVGLAGGLVGTVGLAGGLVGTVGLAGGLVGAVGVLGGGELIEGNCTLLRPLTTPLPNPEMASVTIAPEIEVTLTVKGQVNG